MRYGLLGKKLGHSYSPQIHKHLFGYDYALYETDDVAEFLKNTPFDGLNVTIPYKQTVMPFCAELSERARKIGSVNTVVRRADGTLFGDNTDYYGFCYLLQTAGVDARGKKALVLGSGGASKTVCAVLADMGAREAVVISRSGENNYQNLARHADAQLIVNTTPVGMYPNCGEMPLDPADFPQCTAVADVIYNPAKTALLLRAEQCGMVAVNGLSMLVAQAKLAGEIFTGNTIPQEQIDRTTAWLAGQTKNIVLIGMPGCGKSSVGKALAELTGREFCDLDEKIIEKAGIPIAQIFSEQGEAGFRAWETQVLAEEAAKSGRILAAGGGIVTRAENLPLIRQNSTCIWLKRPLADLPTDGRPVSKAKGVEQIYRERLPLYRAFAEKEYDNCGIVQTAQQIAEEL